MKNMKLIETKTVGAGGVASVTFSSIPQTYTDLKIVMSARVTSGGNTSDNAYVAFNGATDRYYEVLLYGAGTSPGSVSAQNANAYLQWSGSASGSSTTVANTFSNAEVYISNYTSSNSKSVISNWVNIDNSVNSWAGISSGLWNPTSNAPITSITIAARSAATSFVQNSTFYLYGVPNIVTGGAKAYGGIVYEDTSYFYHTFTGSGTFTPNQNLTADILVIAGGGGGGPVYVGGGGGAGGLRLLTSQSFASSSLNTVIIGAGGAGSGSSRGNNSSLGSISATGGGSGSTNSGSTPISAFSGGSGGGANYTDSSGFGAGNLGGYSPVEGYAGGASNATGGAYGSGGGGGAGGAGNIGSNAAAGTGGIGAGGSSYTNYTILNAMGAATNTGELSGGNYYYAGGGGGASYAPSGGANVSGGLGGGGIGSTGQGNAGVANTGGGGGGSERAGGGGGGLGGSGIVIIRYAK